MQIPLCSICTGYLQRYIKRIVTNTSNTRKETSSPMFEHTFKTIDDIFYKDSSVDNELDYIENP